MNDKGLAAAWPKVKEHLLPAIEMADGTHDEKDVFLAIKNHNMDLFVSENSALVTEPVVYPRLKALRIFLAGGNLGEIKQMVELIEVGAAKWGFDRIEFGGRNGWSREMKPHGYREAGRYCIKEI